MDAITIVIVLATLLLAFGIGTNDETMASVVGSGTLTLNKSVILGGILACIGCIFLSDRVGQNIGSSLFGETIQTEYSLEMMLAIILSTSIWLVGASKFGAPISTTHSVVGAVLGVAFIWSFIPGNDFIDSLNWLKLGKIAIGWILSPILGFLTAAFVQIVLQKLFRRKYRRDGKIGFDEIEKNERLLQYFLLIFISVTELSRGGNDSANATGIYFNLIANGQISGPFSTLVLILTGVMIGIGIIFIGRNVIKNVGSSLIEMRPSDAIAIESANGIVILSCTLLGLPISASHVLIFAIVGSGIVKNEKPNWKSLKKMILAWIITFPVAAALSGFFYLGFILIL
jgi:PiT family inorganic phosphate transporter